MKSALLFALLSLAPLVGQGQTLTVEPAVAKQGQAIVGTLTNVPDLPAGAIEPQVTVTLEGGAAINCGLWKIHFWPSLPTAKATWKRTAHIPVVEEYLVPGPNYKTDKTDTIIKTRVVSDATVEQTVTADVKLEGVTPPTPPPGPDPPPGPVVTAKNLWLVLITDWKVQTPLQTKLLTDVAYWNAQEAKGHKHEQYQTGTADASRFTQYHKHAVDLVVMDAVKGTVLGVEEVPTDASQAWADATIAKYAGVK